MSAPGPRRGGGSGGSARGGGGGGRRGAGQQGGPRPPPPVAWHDPPAAPRAGIRSPSFEGAPRLEPRRVVCLLASGTEIVCALDCGERLVGRSHECDQPPWVKKLPAVTTPRLDTRAPSGEIDRSVRALVAQALSVYTVDAARLAALERDLLVTQVQCEVCAVSLRDVEE